MHRESGLADTADAGQRGHHHCLAGTRPQHVPQLVDHLASSTEVRYIGRELSGRNERGRLLRDGLRRCDEHRHQFRVAGQDAGVHRGQRGAGLHTQFFDQQFAGVGVHTQRLGLPATAVERQHQQLAQALAQRMGGRQRVELGHHVGVQPDLQCHRAAFLGDREPTLRQSAALCLGVRSRNSGQRASAPQVKRGHQAVVGGAERSFGTGVRRLRHALLEDREVQGLRRDPQRVAVAHRDQHLGRLADFPVRFQNGTEPGDVGAQRGHCLRWSAVAPDAVHQVVSGHRAALAEQQGDQDRLLLRRSERQRGLTTPCLDRAEHLEAQRLCGARALKLHVLPCGR